MTYVDGMVAAAPANGKEAYLEYAKRAAEVFNSLGATSVIDCWGETVPDGEVTSFPLAVKMKEDEVVVFSWVEWPRRKLATRPGRDSRTIPPFSSASARCPSTGSA